MSKGNKGSPQSPPGGGGVRKKKSKSKEQIPAMDTLVNKDVGPVVIVLVIECTLHGTVGLSNLLGRHVYNADGTKSPIYFFPIGIIDEIDEWEASATALANYVIFGHRKGSQEARIGSQHLLLINIAHVQMSRDGNWVRRVTFLIRIGNLKSRTADLCCSMINSLNWFKLEDMMNLPDRPNGTPISLLTAGHQSGVLSDDGRALNVSVWGSEVQLYSKSLLTDADKDKLSIQLFQEQSLRESLDIYPGAPTSHKDIEHLIDYEQMILVSGVRKVPEAVILYEQFVNHSFPSLVMNYTSFMDYFKMIGWGPIGPDDVGHRGSNEAVGRRRGPKRGSSETGPFAREVVGLGQSSQGNGQVQRQPSPPGRSKSEIMSANDAYLLDVFNSFRVYGQPWVRFNEFLYGIAAFSNHTPHGGPPGAARTMYIFRFFDADRDGSLNVNEFSNFRAEILRIKSGLKSSSSLNGNQRILDAVKQDYKAMKLNYGSDVDFGHFIEAIGSLKLRGSAILCRSKVPIVPSLTYDKNQSNKNYVRRRRSGLGHDENDKKCNKHKIKEYNLESVECSVNGFGDLIELFPMDADILEGIKDGAKIESSEMFNSNTIQTKIIDLVYYVAQANAVIPNDGGEGGGRGNGKRNKKNSSDRKPERLDWTNMPNDVLEHNIEQVVQLLNKCKEYYSRQPFVVHVQSPVHVFGDIHGNLEDLLNHENVFWRKGPLECSNFLFLGDYVDRGIYSLEVILYLLSLKMKSPSKFTLLRGNHETRTLQMSFTFRREVIEKLARKFVFEDGKTDLEGTERSHCRANQVWELINQVFDVFPVACIIDSRIFTAHGGIPYSYNDYVNLCNKDGGSKVPLADPENESAVVWQMLWNDPAEEEDAKRMTDLTGSGTNSMSKAGGVMNMDANATIPGHGGRASNALGGFLPNEKRGTAYLFTDKAVDTFLANQGLDHVIRAHEVIPQGYRFQMNGKVMTIFSCSRYCDTGNKAAAALVHDEKIRIIRIDT